MKSRPERHVKTSRKATDAGTANRIGVITMGYLFIGIALFCLTVKGYSGKKTSTHVRHAGDSILFNAVRMLLCIAIGAVAVLCEGSPTGFAIDGGMLLICLLSGAANALFLVGWMLAIRKNAMVTVDVTLTIGSILPSVLCAILFQEALSLQKMIGFALIVAAVLILSGYNRATKKSGVIGILLLALATLGDGLTGFCQQLYKQFYTASSTQSTDTVYTNSIYHFYTYIFAAAILLILFVGYLLLTHKHTENETREQSADTAPFSSLAKPLPHIFIMAVCLFAASYLQTLATRDFGISSQVLYPVIKGGCLITVNLTASLFFGERITKRSILGSAVALCGILAMSLL